MPMTDKIGMIKNVSELKKGGLNLKQNSEMKTVVHFQNRILKSRKKYIK